MDSLDKRTTDYQKGRVKRERIANYLNSLLMKHEMGIKFVRMHPHLKTMNLHDRTKNNTLKNKIVPATLPTAMGLSYLLTNEKKSFQIPFIFGFMETGGFYLKVSGEYKTKPTEYLNTLTSFDYKVILVRGITCTAPISIAVFANNWRYKMAESKGNKNRLQFFGKYKDIVCSHPEIKSLIDGSILDQIKALTV